MSLNNEAHRTIAMGHRAFPFSFLLVHGLIP